MTVTSPVIACHVPSGWVAHLTPHAVIGLGLDVATTENAKSNPSALALVEKTGLHYRALLVVRWKTAEPAVTIAFVRHVLGQLKTQGRQPRRLCIDASSERFFAAQLKRELTGQCPVTLVVNSESVRHLGEKMNYKTYLGNLLVNALEDRKLAIPDQAWLSKDIGLVIRNKGGFETETDESGNHGDTFDALKLGLYACTGAGGGRAAAAAVEIGHTAKARAGIELINPLYKPHTHKLHV